MTIFEKNVSRPFLFIFNSPTLRSAKLVYLLIKVYFLKKNISHLNFKMAAIFQVGRNWRCRDTTFVIKIDSMNRFY